MLKHSDLISKLLEAKPACFKQAKGLSVFSIGGHFHKCQRFWDELEAKLLVSGEMCWGSCMRGVEQNLVFLGTEEEIIGKLEALKPPVNRMPTPANVMAKMVASRLGKLQDWIHIENPLTLTLEPVLFSDLEDCLQRFCHAHVKAAVRLIYGPCHESPLIDEFRTVLARKEITPEVLQKAWSLFSVKDVMST